MRNTKIQQYIIMLIVMMSSTMMFSQFGGGDPVLGDCGITSYRDADGDGWGNYNNKTCQLTIPSGYVSKYGDINDNNQWITNIPPKNFYRDADGDGWGNPNIKTYRSVQPSGYVTNNSDRDDSTSLITNIAPRHFYRDADGDGYGHPGISTYRSVQPSGYVTNSSDCNDGSSTIHPNTVWYKDSDGDGFAIATKKQCSNPGAGYTLSVLPVTDCHDGDSSLNPNTVWYPDGDSDGWGTASDLGAVKRQCSQPTGYTQKVGDCNDHNINIHPETVWYKNSDGDGFASTSKVQCTNPGAEYTYEELPLGDCDDSDAAIHPNTVWYKNSDGDGFASTSKVQCSNPGAGYSLTVKPLGDCDDSNAAIHPNTVWYKNSDGDDFASTTKTQCAHPGSGYSLTVKPLGDCDDGSAAIHPNTVWYADTDGDGFGDPNVLKQQCIQPAGYVLNNNDQCPEKSGPQQGCIFIPHQLHLSNENYVFTRVYQKPMTSPDQIHYNKDVIESVTYFDGLGRTKQQIAIKASPDGKDIVTHIGYDEYGRQDKQYLPFESNTTVGSYKDVDIVNDINQYYETKYADDFIGVAKGHKDFNAYSESVFEASPLNRVVEQGAPGKDWKANKDSDTDHTIKFNWDTNIANEVVAFKVNFANPGDTETPALVQDGFYPANQLYVTITKDENWTAADGHNHTTKEYKDKQGRVILKRTFANVGAPSVVEAHDTYYVYDRFGNLTYVIPPKVTTNDSVSESELSELCYQYKYDNRNRLIEKKIPGKDWEYIVYNKLDQPILTQDASLRKEMTGKAWDQWLFTKYDGFGRVLYTGTVINGSNRKVIQNRVNDATTPQYESKLDSPITIGGTTVYYSKDAYPTSIYKVFTINYYDDYAFLGATPQQAFIKPNTIYGEAVSDQTKTLATGSLVKILDTSYWTTTVTYYDKKARPIYIASKNEYLNTTDIVESDLDFTGKVKQTKTTHTKDSNANIVTIDTFTYDDMGRLLIQTQKINDQGVETIVENRYDALGQLERKKTGGGLQEVDYTYNVRGWLTKINDPNTALGNKLFSFKINYNIPQHGATALFNGNISETAWKTANDNVERHYKYSYDNLNRIVGAISNDGNYNLSGVTYDKTGNILSLNRKGHLNTSANSFGNMDILTYTYDSGNKLLKVTDTGNTTFGFKDGSNTGNDFAYDANGNMTVDNNKNITGITYNHLNLPTRVNVNGGTEYITYIYSATGAKLKKIAREGSSLITEYAGNYVYKNGVLEFFNHSEGIVEKEDDGFKYVYQYKDHNDNIRLSYKDADKNGTITQDEIIQEKNYYPFGMTHSGYNTTLRGRNHNYGFVGKEEQEEFGLAWLDFGARNYDASLGRWMNLDPMSEKFYGWTPYKYSLNNPVLFMDPDGNCETCLKALKKYYGGVWNGFKNTITTAGSAVKQAIADPIGTVKAAASDHLDRVTNPVRLISDTVDAVSTVNPTVGVVKDAVAVATSDDPISAVGNQVGKRLANQAMETVGQGGGVVVSKAVKMFKGISKSTKLSTDNIRFSQTSVNGLEGLIDSMKKNGWDGDPIDVVKMDDGGLTTIDNTRVLAAHEAGIDVQAVIHNANDLLPDNMIERFTTKKGVPKTWGEAAMLRIQKQNSGYRNTYPNGSQVINGKN